MLLLSVTAWVGDVVVLVQLEFDFTFLFLGPCDVREVDFAGHEREVFLCNKTQDEDFSLVNLYL